MTTKNRLPLTCYVQKENGDVVRVKYGMTGYFPTLHYNNADQLNERNGTTLKQASIMKSGSIFGWNIPLVTDYLEGL